MSFLPVQSETLSHITYFPLAGTFRQTAAPAQTGPAGRLNSLSPTNFTAVLATNARAAIATWIKARYERNDENLIPVCWHPNAIVMPEHHRFPVIMAAVDDRKGLQIAMIGFASEKFEGGAIVPDMDNIITQNGNGTPYHLIMTYNKEIDGVSANELVLDDAYSHPILEPRVSTNGLSYDFYNAYEDVTSTRVLRKIQLSAEKLALLAKDLCREEGLQSTGELDFAPFRTPVRIDTLAEPCMVPVMVEFSGGHQKMTAFA